MRKYYGTDDKNIVKINDEFSFNLNKRVLLKDGKMVDLRRKRGRFGRVFGLTSKFLRQHGGA